MIDIYVINLVHRKDRWDHIVKTFSYPEFNLIRVEAEIHKKPWVGCFMSHKKCIQIAKDKGLQNIWVLEDDCEPTDISTFKDRFIKIKNYLDSFNDWNIFLGGTATLNPNSYSKIIRFDDQVIVEFSRAYMTHMVCYNSNIYDLFLTNQMKRPIDEFWFDKIKALIPVPFIATQLEGFSDIVKKRKSDKLRINHANNILIKYINK